MDNPIQYYSWGSRRLIPDLLGEENLEEKPYAELWMGAHPRGTSWVNQGEEERRKLSDLIVEAPKEYLGAAATGRFDSRLPFLFKVLAAERALSIQAHPNLRQAEEGYWREEERGLAVDAFERNYRDQNHKPELICALTPFTALCGFRPVEDIRGFYCRLESRVFEQDLSLENEEQGNWLREFFHKLMSLDESKTHRLLTDLLRWAEREKNVLPEAALVLKLRDQHGMDLGIQAPLFLNLVHLEPGEALYQAAGVLHAYVEGMGVELMANSDNVLRGGLTEKHIDADELLKILSFEPAPADIIRGRALEGGFEYYPVPIDEFQLLRGGIEKGETLHRRGRYSLDIALCSDGQLRLRGAEGAGGGELHLQRGESCLIPHAFGEYEVDGGGELFIATIPPGRQEAGSVQGKKI